VGGGDPPGDGICGAALTTEGGDQQVQGYVVTFDDITELVSAQRSTAWADVARRIAHEIKNPLTPIQLSAERIRRKYGDSITKDREVFDQCTDTIIRQVSDIGRMVDEFSAFARMPKPVMERQDVRDIVREAVFLFQVSRPEITFDLDLPDKPAITLADQRLLTQAVTNLVKNASEAIDSALEADPDRTDKGHITAKVRIKGDRVQVTVIDNGCGLPKENRQRLVEPYMTTRAKGTGLGLAIVQRITEQHAGTLHLADAPKRNGKVQGASVRMDIPVGEIDEPRADGDAKTREGDTKTREGRLAIPSPKQSCASTTPPTALPRRSGRSLRQSPRQQASRCSGDKPSPDNATSSW
jgi:two-component system nitrogen regulation sensor histidine kinase NtrY